MIRESQVNFLIPLTENLQTCIFHESFFPKYNNSKIISIIVICQSNCLELSEWDWLMKEKIQMLSQMFWFVLNVVIYQHEKLKKKKKQKQKKTACTDFENVNAALNLHLYEGN